MAFDELLANRVRPLLGGSDRVSEKKMFGGLAFLVQGNMSVGIYGMGLLVRLDPAEMDEALRQPGTRIFDMAGRPMKGWLLVSAGELTDPQALADWVDRGVSYARSLPAK